MSIEALDKESIHRICSGQAIVDLATAVKELVENALDAKATKIDIKLKQYGLKEIDVRDNGNGISKENHASICLKHHTSKIHDFADLAALQSFGFRGEALSSLCALSTLEVHTRTEEDEMGSRLKFDGKGVLAESALEARPKGTTVVMKDLFHTLPVRHKGFTKTIKRQYGKMLNVIQAYALMVRGVKFTLTNTVGSKKSTVVQVNDTEELRVRIGSVYGFKVSRVLDEIKNELPCGISLYGFCSNPSQVGRSSSDRQHFYLNSRPVDLPKVQRMVNSVFKRFRKKQFPFLLLNFKLRTDSYDVNVDPNKRAVFIHKMADLIKDVEKFFEKTWDANSHSFEVKTIDSIFRKKETKSENKESKPEEKKDSNPAPVKFTRLMPVKPHVKCFLGCGCKNPADLSNITLMKKLRKKAEEKRKKKKEKSKSRSRSSSPEKEHHSIWGPKKSPNKKRSIWDQKKPSSSPEQQHSILGSKKRKRIPSPEKQERRKRSIFDVKTSPKQAESSSNIETELQTEDNLDSQNHGPVIKNDESEIEPKPSIFNQPDRVDASNSPTKPAQEKSSTISIKRESESHSKPIVVKRKGSHHKSPTRKKPIIQDPVTPKEIKSEPSEKSDPSPWNVFATAPKILKKSPKRKASSPEPPPKKRKANDEEEISIPEFRSDFNLDVSSFAAEFETLCKSSENKEEIHKKSEVRKKLFKDDFKKMRVIGQFNLGFIICEYNSDLYIIDQHASNEKFRFENLQESTKLRSQKLLIPKSLEMTRQLELTVIENMKIFDDFGFKIKLNEEAPPTKKLKLMMIPYTAKATFGSDDITELAVKLSEGETAPSLSKLTRVLAMRACRSAIKIGTPLSTRKMQEVVESLATLKQPWNCPHGRPTMQHCVDLSQLAGGIQA